MANDQRFANNASAVLAASIDTVATTVQVAAGFGSLFPSPTGSQYFYATLEDNSGSIEVVKCTSRSADVLTVVRAQDGTTATAFTLTVTRVELRLVRLNMQELLQKNGGTMTGAIDMNGNSLTDAVLDGSATQITAGEIVGVPLRGLTATATNEIAVPIDGTSRATVGGANILASGDDIVAELDTAGVISLDSATIGVRIRNNAYLRIEGLEGYIEVSHDDEDLNITGTGTTAINIDTQIDLTNNIDMLDNQIIAGEFVDFAVTQQTVAAATTTNVDYTAGSYVILTMGADISSLVLENPPATEVGSFRFKIVQDATGSRTITWPGSFRWTGGSAMVLTTTANAVDYLDVWTDDGGTTWYAGYNNNWTT